jgi:hypothetical protein
MRRMQSIDRQVSQQRQDADDNDDRLDDLLGTTLERQKIDEIEHQNDDQKRDQDADKNGHRPAPLLMACGNACRHTGQDARTDINYAGGTKFPGLLPAETWRPPMRGLAPARVAISLTSSVGVAAANELAPTGTLRATFIATDPVEAGTDAISSTADMHCYRRS